MLNTSNQPIRGLYASGDILGPVRTEFGWHVIKLEDKREKAPPPLESVETQLRGVILRAKANETVKALKDAAAIEYAEGMEPAPLPGQAPKAEESESAN